MADVGADGLMADQGHTRKKCMHIAQAKCFSANCNPLIESALARDRQRHCESPGSLRLARVDRGTPPFKMPC